MVEKKKHPIKTSKKPGSEVKKTGNFSGIQRALEASTGKHRRAAPPPPQGIP